MINHCSTYLSKKSATQPGMAPLRSTALSTDTTVLRVRLAAAPPGLLGSDHSLHVAGYFSFPTSLQYSSRSWNIHFTSNASPRTAARVGGYRLSCVLR